MLKTVIFRNKVHTWRKSNRINLAYWMVIVIWPQEETCTCSRYSRNRPWRSQRKANETIAGLEWYYLLLTPPTIGKIALVISTHAHIFPLVLSCTVCAIINHSDSNIIIPSKSTARKLHLWPSRTRPEALPLKTIRYTPNSGSCSTSKRVNFSGVWQLSQHFYRAR